MIYAREEVEREAGTRPSAPWRRTDGVWRFHGRRYTSRRRRRHAEAYDKRAVSVGVRKEFQ